MCEYTAWSVCETSIEETYHSFEDNIWFAVLWRVDNTWTVDEEDAPHQRDVLPHLKISSSLKRLGHIRSAIVFIAYIHKTSLHSLTYQKGQNLQNVFPKWISVAGVMKFHPQILHSCEENRRRTRQINASCCSCWRHGSIIKYFSRANLRMLRLLPRPPIRGLNFFSRPTTNKIPLFSIHRLEGPWPCEENQRQDQK